MEKLSRTHCGCVGLKDIDKKVLLTGWVDALRDHGETLFIHLRDRSGIVQAVFNKTQTPPDVFKQSELLKNEYCVKITGQVSRRTPETENPHISTGQLEVIVNTLEILSVSATPPFSISEKAMAVLEAEKSPEQVAEDLRLQYRYLDLRRPYMQEIFIKRHKINKAARDYLDARGFIEIETPMLTKSTPEGARDYLVPSRIFPKHFYALPQSPQLFKQLLMVSGFERYYQLARCFRDEDLRPNRQPEFTQLDIEASFIDEEFIYGLVEGLAAAMFKVGGIQLKTPFMRMPYSEAIDSYGTDKPDLRFGMKFIDATDIFKNTSYSIFKQILKRGGVIKGITVKNSSECLSKNVLQNEYAKQIVPSFGAKGMTWMRVIDNKLESNIVQFFSAGEQAEILKRFGAQSGDVLLMIADPSYELVCSALGQLRLHIAGRLNIISENIYVPLWVTDFPLFEAADGGVTSSHHPFTAPDRNDFDPENTEELLKLKSRAYDFVINGEEVGGGSIRINLKETQYKIFKALSLSDDEINEKFGFFIDAFNYGPPPHGGLALGMDRIVSMIVKTGSIREVIAFPKNRKAFCPLTQAPSPVTAAQLEELELLNLSGASEKITGAGIKENITDYISWVSRIGVREEEKEALDGALRKAVELAAFMDSNPSNGTPRCLPGEIINNFREETKAENHPLSKDGSLFKKAPAVKGNYFKTAGIIEQE